MAKTVAIVGAGPSGLVAAKTLLHDVPGAGFKVTIFEAQPRIGGLWPLSSDDGAGLVHPLMLVNQSKHTVQFSDLAWETGAPDFPRAWRVGQYLKRYLERYCDAADLRLGCKVEQTEVLDGNRWRVHSRSEKGEDTEDFDYFLISSGYFGKPSIPPGLPTNPEIPVIHSSKYRDLQTLFTKADGRGGKILVVGGQFSGVEIAGTIANHLSSALHSPGQPPIPNPEKYSIHHIIQRPSWVFPLFTSPKAALPAAPFLPLDLPSYNLANRPLPLSNTQGHISMEGGMLSHSIYESVVGTNQSDFSPSIHITREATHEPPYLAVSDTYMDHVRSRLITVSNGRLSTISGNTATISPPGEDMANIAAVILATGFDASSSVSFLPSFVQSTLSVTPNYLNNTLALAFHGTHHPSVPTLGFVGFYRSPYWGVMEMQARFLATLWTNPDFPSLQKALSADISIPRTLSLRQDPRASQFPMGDYAFLMQEFASALDLSIVPPPGPTPPLPHNNLPMDILTPARYPSRNLTAQQQAENASALAQTHSTALAGLTGGKYLARAVFRSLLGSWALERTVASRSSHPSGRFTGTAQFLLRDGTLDGRPGSEDLGLEYLYIETGTFAANNGLRFGASRRYVWRYDEREDRLSVWFVKPEENRRADYLFHDVEFVVPKAGEENEGKGWEAKAGHLCIADYYDVKYEFCFNAVNLREWRIGYTVKGPDKDYTLDGVYTRDRA